MKGKKVNKELNEFKRRVKMLTLTKNYEEASDVQRIIDRLELEEQIKKNDEI
jgi:hypothetical protein